MSTAAPRADSEGAAGGPARTAPWRALRHPNYRLYFGGQAVSLLGTWTQQVALGWLVYRLTGSAMLLGTVAFLSQAPQLLIAPLAGIVIDRCERRRLMLAVQLLMLGQAVFLAVLTRLGWIAPGHILLAALALGLLNSFDAPLRHALAGQLVADRDDLPNAIALNAMVFNVARFVGPPFAGLALGMTSEAACFAFNALSYLAIVLALLKIRIAPVRAEHAAFATALREGLQYVRHNLPANRLLMQVALLNFLGASYVGLMPAFAGDVFHGGPNTLGILLGSAGAGALGASLYLISRRTVRGLTGTIAAANLLAGLALVAFSLSDALGLGTAMLFLLGFGVVAGNASSNTILQTILPAHLRGRVLALYTAANLGAAAVGSLAAGVVAERLGPNATLLASGILLSMAAGHFRARLEYLRMHLRPLYASLGIIPGQPADSADGRSS